MNILLSRSSRMAMAVAVPLAIFSVGGVAAQQSGASGDNPASAGMDHGGMDHGGMDHGGMDHGMGHGAMGGGGMGCGMGAGMGAGTGGGMGHGMGCGMGHGGMSREGGADHEAHGQGGKASMPMARMMCRTGEHVEARLAYLKAELKPTEAQAAKWNVFADAIRESGSKIADFCASLKKAQAGEAEGDRATPHGVLDQLALMERNMTAHLDQVRTVRAAAEPLFAVLTDEQKKIAEEIMTGMMGFGMGKGKMGMGKM
jgi:hypothetical protein